MLSPRRSATPFSGISAVPSVRGARVLLRASLNERVEDGRLLGSYRIESALPTIRTLVECGARVIILAHIGRDPHASLMPVFKRMRRELPMQFSYELTGPRAAAAVASARAGDVLMLENVRSDAREQKNDAAFARELAAHGDVFVNDAFAASHREHASIVGIPNYLPSYAGCRFVAEYEALSDARDPEQPAVCILGGAKVATKLPLMTALRHRYDTIYIGGALANDFLHARGYEVGRSRLSEYELSHSTLLNDPRVVLPSDVVVERADGGDAIRRIEEVEPTDTIYDVGPETTKAICADVADAHSVLWNGPLGYYEAGYDAATREIARALAVSDAQSTIGGGDTISVVTELGTTDRYSFVSTAGGAMLAFLERGTLPGIDALNASSRTRNQ